MRYYPNADAPEPGNSPEAVAIRLEPFELQIIQSALTLAIQEWQTRTNGPEVIAPYAGRLAKRLQEAQTPCR